MSELKDITGPQYFGTAKKKSCFEEGDKSFPGPGTHSPIAKSKITPPQWKIGNSAIRNGFLDPHRAKIPSPQHYRPNHDALEKATKKAVIPQSVYLPKPSNENFSGFHEVSQHFTKTAYPEFSFGYFQQPNYSTLVPGPGTYDTLQSKLSKTLGLKKTQSGFSTAQRPTPYGQEAKFPAPGKYSTISFKTNSKYSFGKASRQRSNNNELPGRFYDLQPKKPVIKLGRGASTQYKREPTFLTPNEYPAPGTYNNEIAHKIPNGVIQTSNRKPIEHSAIVSFPSPDKYATHQDFHKGLTFYKEVRHLQPLKNQAPGPGAYEPMSTLSKVGGAIAKKQNSEEQKVPLPDAATYKPRDEVTRKKASSTLVLRSHRVDFSKTITGIIGPGEYSINSESEGELGKLGRSPRGNAMSPNKNPGVGSYNIPSLIGVLPKYCTSPKKTNECGYSTFHEKLKMKLQQKQKMQKPTKIEKQISEEEPYYTGNNNPQQVKE